MEVKELPNYEREKQILLRKVPILYSSQQETVEDMKWSTVQVQTCAMNSVLPIRMTPKIYRLFQPMVRNKMNKPKEVSIIHYKISKLPFFTSYENSSLSERVKKGLPPIAQCAAKILLITI